MVGSGEGRRAEGVSAAGGAWRNDEHGAAITRKRFRREPVQLIPCRKYN
jgi:hypothetical protein